MAASAALTTLRKIGFGGLTGNRVAFYVICAVLVAMLAVPSLHNGYLENLFRGVLMFGTLSLGWNIIGGYTGYVSFGNVVYFGLGAYTTAALWQHFQQQNLLLAVVIASIVAALVAMLLGAPILRLKGHYFGIGTLGIALATQEIISNIDWLGGGSGYPVRQVANFSSYYYTMWLVCAASLAVTFIVGRSKFGYALVAIRENEEAAAILGVNTTRCKVLAWMLSAVMAASAGAVFAAANGFIDPPTAFAVDANIFPIVMTILGGAGTAAGPLVGAIVLTAINETLWSHFPQIHTLFFGAVIVLVIVFLPRGVLWLLDVRGGWRGLVNSLRAFRV
ncbi:MAG: branched-chain amino acid ABC transporter permease [Candidatus Velthaea sp.]